jgi:hypothetical protein
MSHNNVLSLRWAYNLSSAEDRVYTFGNDMYVSMINHEYSASEKVITIIDGTIKAFA